MLFLFVDTYEDGTFGCVRSFVRWEEVGKDYYVRCLYLIVSSPVLESGWSKMTSPVSKSISICPFWGDVAPRLSMAESLVRWASFGDS